jgi:hypothetical protein
VWGAKQNSIIASPLGCLGVACHWLPSASTGVRRPFDQAGNAQSRQVVTVTPCLEIALPLHISDFMT